MQAQAWAWTGGRVLHAARKETRDSRPRSNGAVHPKGHPLKRSELKRKKPLRPGKPKKKPMISLDDVRSAWKKLIAPINRKRAAKRKLEAFGPPGFVQFVHEYGCVVARQSGTTGGCLGPVEAAHVRSRATGGVWRDGVCGLCVGHHRESHDIGQKTFQKKYEIDLDLWAVAICHQWEKQENGW